MKVRFVAQQPAYVPVAPRPPKAPKAAAPRTVAPLPPVKAPRATTPNVNASMSRKRQASSKESGLAQAIARHKMLRYGQAEHTAFLRDGLAGWQQWKAAQA